VARTAHFLGSLKATPQATHRLINRTRGLVLATRVAPALDSASRRRGLLGRTGLDPSEALAIAPSNAVHTFGMKFPIDVLFVSRDGTVRKRVVALRRGRIALALRAFAVIEFAAHHPGVAQTQIGDVLGVSSHHAPADSES
jgi:uncharacterized membrane protein (UPF0127 family)